MDIRQSFLNAIKKRRPHQIASGRAAVFGASS